MEEYYHTLKFVLLMSSDNDKYLIRLIKEKSAFEIAEIRNKSEENTTDRKILNRF